jgi:hypothetical protein
VAVQRSRFSMKQLRDRVRGDLGLRSNALLTDEDLDFWGLAAQTELAEITHWYRTSTTAGTVDGTALVDLPSDCIAVEEVRHDDLPLSPIRLVDFYRDHPNWRQDAEGTPTHYYLRGTTAIGLHPVPDTTDVDILTIHYTALPPSPALNTDTYYTPTALEEAIVVYCKLRASEKDAHGEGARRLDYYGRQWEQWKQRALAYVGNVAEAEAVVVGGHGSTPDGDWWDVISSRVIPAP